MFFLFFSFIYRSRKTLSIPNKNLTFFIFREAQNVKSLCLRKFTLTCKRISKLCTVYIAEVDPKHSKSSFFSQVKNEEGPNYSEKSKVNIHIHSYTGHRRVENQQIQVATGFP